MVKNIPFWGEGGGSSIMHLFDPAAAPFLI